MSDAATVTIGFIGLGVMGAPMATNLLKGGHKLRVFDLNPDAVATLVAAGAEAAGSARDAATGADCVFTMLPKGEHVRAALFGDGNDSPGAAASFTPDTLYIDMSTILPTDTDAIGAKLADQGVTMVDAPVGRSSQHAIDGKLLIMAGGDAAALERARPLLALLGDSIVHCGALGTGSRMKIINNYLSIAANVLNAEALTLAERIGLDVNQTLDVLRGTPAGIGHLNTTYPSKVLAGDLSPGFMIDLADKDLGLALALAADVNAPTGMGAAARQALGVARVQGRGAQDWTAVYPALRKLAGLDDGGD